MPDERDGQEVAGIAMMVNGLKMIHEANAGSHVEVARCICGAIGAYMAHIAEMKPDQDTVRWAGSLPRQVLLSFKRTSDNMKQRDAAMPPHNSLQ